MRRDIDLCGAILRQNLDCPAEIPLSDRWRDKIVYQLRILRQARLIEASDVSDIDGLSYIPLRLTWHGNEFRDAARDDTIWSKAEARFRSTAGALTFDLLLDASKAEIKNLTELEL